MYIYKHFDFSYISEQFCYHICRYIHIYMRACACLSVYIYVRVCLSLCLRLYGGVIRREREGLFHFCTTQWGMFENVHPLVSLLKQRLNASNQST